MNRPVTTSPGAAGVEWGLIFPDANGEYQSPINLNSREAKYDPSLLEVRLSPNYVVCRDCEVINDGHSIQIALKSKSGMFRHCLRFSRGVLGRSLPFGLLCAHPGAWEGLLQRWLRLGGGVGAAGLGLPLGRERVSAQMDGQ